MTYDFPNFGRTRCQKTLVFVTLLSADFGKGKPYGGPWAPQKKVFVGIPARHDKERRVNHANRWEIICFRYVCVCDWHGVCRGRIKRRDAKENCNQSVLCRYRG